MDVRRTFPFLLLMICAAFAIRNNHGGLNNIRRIRKASLSEYLVPPPPPRFYPGRSPRTAPSTEEPGYLSRLMSWLNPFNYGTTLPSLLSPPPPSTSYETIYTSSPKLNQPRPPPPADYDKPPLPPSSFNNNAGYSTPAKTTNCNSCNKVPWTPLQTNDVTQSENGLHASPTPQVLPTNGNYPSINGNYPPASNPEIPYDAHHAASQDVTAPDYTVISLSEQDLGSPSDPRLYPGLVPPVNKAHNFHSSTTSVKYSSNLNKIDPSIGKYPLYVHSSTSSGFTSPAVINQELGYQSPDASNGHFNIQNNDAHNDLFFSGTQVTHANSVSDNQKLKNVESHSSLPDSSHQQASFGNPKVLQFSGISNNGRPYYVTGSLDDSVGNSSQTDQNLPSSYGTTGPDQVPNNSENRYSDLSSSGNVAKNTYASLSTPIESSTKIEDSIHFEESPLLDFTHKGESRTKSSSIPPTSNAIADSAEAVESTLPPGEEVFGTRQRVASTTTYSQTTDPLSLQPKVNITKNLDRSVYNSKVMRVPNILYVPSSAKTTVSQKSGVSTTTNTTTTTTTTTTPPPEGILSRFSFSWPISFPWPFYTDVKSTNDSKKDASNQNVNLNSEDTNETSVKERGLKKQVQLIIPYTQQHTPLPFYTQKAPQIGSNHDTYVAEESAKAIKVTSLPDSTNAVTSPTTSVTLEDRTRKPAGTVANNSIDVHKLQKNIDNWIIQEYAKSTTASTASPSSASPNPYLLPSKKIPHEYFTTTESLEHSITPYDNSNVKTFNLAGFTFNDVDYKTSTSNRVEKSQVQKSQVQEAQKNSTDDVSVSSLNNTDDAWRGSSISHVNKELVYVVTSKSIVSTLKLNPEQRKETAIKEKNPKESRQETDTKKSTTNTFEKAYQVLPQAVNNLAVASTGPESVPLWGIIEHEEFATPDDKEHDETDEADETSETPVLYFGHSKVSRARR